MPLKLSGIKAVEFGDVTLLPIVNEERRLRLTAGNMTTQAGVEEAVCVMAECFEGHEKQAKELIKNLPIMEICMLEAYLIGGDSGVEAYQRTLEKRISAMTEGDANG